MVSDLNFMRADLALRDTSLISASWNRCLNDYGLDPQKRRRETVIRRERVRDSVEALGPLFSACRSQVQHIFQNIIGSGHSVVLTDKDGTIIDLLVQPTLEGLFRQSGLRRGADWREDNEGTNGIGTAIREKKPLTIYREQHFHASHASLTCTGAPVFDVNGDVVALFDVSSIGRKDDPDILTHTRSLLEMSARLISRRHFQDHFSDKWILRFHEDAERIGMLEEGLLALDDRGRIIGLDQQAMRHLNIEERTDVVNAPLEELLQVEAGSLASRLSGTVRHPVEVHVNRPLRGHAKSVHARLVEPDGAQDQRIFAPGAIPPKRAPKKRFQGLLGPDPVLHNLASQAQKLFAHDVPLLITGETGVGKDTFARALHDASNRANKPFIAVNCSALPEGLIEGELFGYKAGAFTGAQANGFKGQILAANGGTLLLDEIGDMPLAAQTRLLRVLETREVIPLGSTTGIALDIRLLAATHQSLDALCAQGRFREDLYYRICGFNLPLPPLRSRKDLAALVSSILPGRVWERDDHVCPAARTALMAYHWPGNIRQLSHILKTADILADGEAITCEHLNLPVRADQEAHDNNPCEVPRPLDLSHQERTIIETALQEHVWNVSRAAQALSLSRNTLYRKMKTLGIRRAARHGQSGPTA